MVTTGNVTVSAHEAKPSRHLPTAITVPRLQNWLIWVRKQTLITVAAIGLRRLRITMYRIFAALFVVVTIAGCAAPPQTPVQVLEQSSSYGSAQVLPSSCTLMPGHHTKEGIEVPTSYRCSTMEPIAEVPAGACTTVAGYYRRDGVYVGSHQRCQLSAFRAFASTPSYGSGSAPCVTGSCGPISVRGYTRKDGTYVRPHTRSRGRR